jgi:hypothetical protein
LWFDGGMKTLENLLTELKGVCAGLTDRRRSTDCTYTMADIGMAAFSMLFHAKPVVSCASGGVGGGPGTLELPDLVRHGEDTER